MLIWAYNVVKGRHMERTTEPKLTAEDATDEQKHALKPFLRIVQRSPAKLIATLSILREGTIDSKTARPLRHIADIVGLVLETEVDLEALPDPETAEAMRRAIKDVASDERRLARLTAFVLATQSWQRQQAVQEQPVQLEPTTQLQQADTSAA